MTDAAPALAPKALTQRKYDAYRDGKHKPRRAVSQIGSAEAKELGVTKGDAVAAGGGQ